jgi:hypothetical protein
MEPAAHLLPARGPSTFLERLWQMLRTEVDAIWDGISVTYLTPTSSSDSEVSRIEEIGTSLAEKACNEFFLQGNKLPSRLTWLEPKAMELRLKHEAAAAGAILPQNPDISSFSPTSLGRVCRGFILYDSEVEGSIPVGHTWWVPCTKQRNLKLQIAGDHVKEVLRAYRDEAANYIACCAVNLKCELDGNDALKSVVSYEQVTSIYRERFALVVHDAETLSWRRSRDGCFRGFSIIGEKAELVVASLKELHFNFNLTDEGLDEGIILKEALVPKLFCRETINATIKLETGTLEEDPEHEGIIPYRRVGRKAYYR